MPSLPPLTSLRAFEASARYKSFTKAAEELCVTSSAVSRHIRHLEEIIGKRLFVRAHRELIFTAEGQRYFDDLSGLFRQIEWATARVADKSGREQLHLHSQTTFAQRWLLPRLAGFHLEHPNIDVRLSTSTAAFEPEHNQAQAIIHAGNDLIETSDRLFPVTYVPVCTASYRNAHIPKGTAEELDSVTLIHSLGVPAAWQTWFRVCQLRNSRNERDLRVETTAMAITAATSGLGVAIASWPFVEEAVAAGRLVIPIPMAVVLRRYYYYLPVGQNNATSAAQKFRSWLLAQIDRDAPAPEDVRIFTTATYAS